MIQTIETDRHVFLTQKDNVNNDGTSNWEKNKEWGRFNQCMNSTHTAVVSQNFIQLKRYGVECKTTGRLDEMAMYLALEDMIEEDGGDFKKERFHWARHAELMTKIVQASFGEKFFYEHNIFTGSLEKMKLCLEAGFQFSLGLKMKSVISGVDGHVVGISGIKMDQGRLVSFKVQDPAGNANVPSSYRELNYEVGENVIYKKDLIDKCLFLGVNSYIVLKVKK
ncbi:hypothetical protein [Leptospira phage LE4]|uniref:Uncharacterized protein n=1 Tax=Leptospira phage LE4 TaxID=2041383 RepID=A0A343LEE9_9CAUD|nr:hypothetical protein HWB34_gp46 [Leptospira phage LE4]ATN95059.1 hypothetical protein [Leptospira phage LE4]